MLLPPRKLPAWLNDAAAEPERELTAVETADGMAGGSSGPSEAPAVDESAEKVVGSTALIESRVAGESGLRRRRR